MTSRTIRRRVVRHLSRRAGLAAACLSLAVAAAPAWADVRLAPVFTSHMVLQRDQPLRVWGWADANAELTLTLHDRRGLPAGTAVATPQHRATADAQGRFAFTLPPLAAAAGSIALTVAQGEDEVTLEDILVGDVWIAGGQSNMEWSMGRSDGFEAFAKTADLPAVRALRMPRRTTPEPQTEADTKGWRMCTPESAGSFSGVGLFFAADLHATLKDAAGHPVPIGIIESYYGGTSAEAWTPRDVLEATPEASPILARWKEPGTAPGESPEELDRAQRELTAQLLTSRLPDEAGFEGVTLPPPSSPAVAQWNNASLPGEWPANLDGVMWYRRTVALSAEQAAAAAALVIPPIDDYDHAYINGVLVGSIGQETADAWQTPRRYTLPAGTLRPGDNVIALRILDNTGAGGISGRDEAFHIELAGQSPVPLAGPWSSRVAWNAANHGGFPAAKPTARDIDRPAGLYNAMLHPCVPFNVKGVIWYQGESNAARAEQYRTLFPTLITAWRGLFQNPDMPFLYVQLANHTRRLDAPGESNWAELREAQHATLRLPNTGMVSAIDIGEANDIHPRNKRDVGLRLAAEAKRIAYGDPTSRGHGPRLASVAFNGATADVMFTFAQGLATRDGLPPRGFAVAGPLTGGTPEWHWAQAEFVTHDDGTTLVRLTCPAVPVVAAVRYAWATNPDACLINAAGLPAEPFRTDTWPGVTTGLR